MKPVLSVIIPTYNRRELTERAVRSVLDGCDDLPVEVVVVDDHSNDGTLDGLRDGLSEWISNGRVTLLSSEVAGDPAANRNLGVRRSSGNSLAFLDSDDYWREGRTRDLLSKLDTFDFGSLQLAPAESRDPLDSCLECNKGNTSATVVSRDLFEKVGGFPEGYYGPGRKKLVGFEDYELWLLCLIELAREGRMDRYRPLDPQSVYVERHDQGVGRLSAREQMRRETFTLSKIFRKLPWKYRPLAARRLLGTLKGSFAP